MTVATAVAPIKVLLVEDHFMARLALRSILGNAHSLSIVGEAADGHDAVSSYTSLRPDVTVMDLNLPQLIGFGAITAIRALNRGAKIVVLSNYEGSEDVYRADDGGARSRGSGRARDSGRRRLREPRGA